MRKWKYHPKLFKFRLANKNLQNSDTCRKYQKSLLQTEIDNNKSFAITLQNEFNRLHSDLQFRLNYINFDHISAIFLG